MNVISFPSLRDCETASLLHLAAKAAFSESVAVSAIGRLAANETPFVAEDGIAFSNRLLSLKSINGVDFAKLGDVTDGRIGKLFAEFCEWALDTLTFGPRGWMDYDVLDAMRDAVDPSVLHWPDQTDGVGPRFHMKFAERNQLQPGDDVFPDWKYHMQKRKWLV
jgi:hypothetical protein